MMSIVPNPAALGDGPWSTEDGDVMWILGPHTEAFRWAVRREIVSEYGWDYWDKPVRATRVWLMRHRCVEPEECWCAAFDGAENCIDEVPKGTPGAASGWRVEVR